MYLVFGQDRSNYQQAIFSILSLLPQLHDNDEVVVITDSCDRFEILNTKIRIIKISNETLEAWKGNYGNFFRIKIMAMLHVAKDTNNKSILYLDADTFLFGNFQNLRVHLENGYNIMHTNEGKLSASKSKSQKPMWKSLKGKTVENIVITDSLCMWNAGVIGISKAHIDALDIALKLCDTISKTDIKPRLIEQLSVSIALSHLGGIQSAENDIGHYWGNKPMWNEKIEDVFLDNYFKNLTIEDLTQTIKTIDFKEIPIHIKSRDTKLRLQKLVSYIFKDRKVEFIKKRE
ncbi:MAG: hypothetical protein R2797_03535 [Gelidibacter sp.]